MKVLIADDDMALRFITQKLVESWGLDAVLVADGQEALNVMTANEEHPRLLLIDWEMPKIDGIDLCKQLRLRETDNPPYIILITSRNEPGHLVTALNAGANDFISKPTNSAELRARITVGMRTLELQNRLNIANNLLFHRANHDELTGLLNRGSALATLDKEIIRAQRTKGPLAIALCDIDFFKKVNDDHGHIAGDRVLMEFANRLTQAFRPYDIVGRYGGEEFIIICSSSTQQAAEIFERFRQTIADTPFLAEDLNLPITASVGIRTYEGEEIETKQVLLSLIADADLALYRAKYRGRNRVCMVSTTVNHADNQHHIDQLIKDVPSL